MSRLDMNPTAGWQQVIMFEVDAESRRAVDAFARSIASEARILPAAHSPSGYAWFEVEIDFSHGERRAVLLAGNLVEALEAAELPGYRLLSGREWMDLAVSQTSLDAALRPATHSLG